MILQSVPHSLPTGKCVESGGGGGFLPVLVFESRPCILNQGV